MIPLRIPMPSMVPTSTIPIQLSTLAPAPATPLGKEFCVDPDHQTIQHCLSAAELVTSPVSGAQQCILVGMTNAALAFADLTAPAKVAEHPLPTIIEAGMSLWRTTESAIVRAGPYLAQHLSPETLQGLLDAYLYFGTMEQQRNAAIVLYSLQKPKLLLLNTMMAATPGVGWLAKGLQLREVLATRERTDYDETNSTTPAGV